MTKHAWRHSVFNRQLPFGYHILLRPIVFIEALLLIPLINIPFWISGLPSQNNIRIV